MDALSSLMAALIPVAPDLSLMAVANALKSVVVTLADTVSPFSVMDTMPFMLRLLMVAVVLPVADTPVVSDTLLTAAAISAAVLLAATDTEATPSPVTVSDCEAAKLPLLALLTLPRYTVL